MLWNWYSDTVRAVIVFACFFIIGRVLYYIIETYLKKNTGDHHPIITTSLSFLAKPLYIFFVLSGAFAGTQIAEVPSWVATWTGIVHFIFVAGVLAYVLDRVSSNLIKDWLKRQDVYEQTPELINKAISIIIYIVAGLIVLDHYNVEISPFIATLGLGGVAVGLALQDTLKDFFAGVHIISDRPVRVGDFVELETMELAGFVRDIGWRSTRINTIEGNVVVVPNSKLAGSTITNDSMPQNEMSLVVDCGVDYGSDLDWVEEVTLDVARDVQEEVDGAVPGWEPTVRWKEFGPSNVNFGVVLRINQYLSKYDVRNAFMKRLHARYRDEGIEISWPIRKIHETS